MTSSTETGMRSSTPRTLVIMAKAPRAGTVKTRLARDLPPSAVTELYRSLLQDSVALAKLLKGVEVAVMCRESDRGDLAVLLGDTIEIVTQNGEGLAAGLISVFRHFTAGAKRHVIAFNSDSPHLAPTVLESAFEVLAHHDVVVGPTHDGGYYLVGAKTDHPTLFENDGLGTRSALERLLTRTNTLQLSTGFTEPFYDIDVADDLLRLARELRVTPARAPRTAVWFKDWSDAVAQLSRSAEVP